jgi:ubiquinone/menaquinone biosynthesis C-methylase UbiE
LLVVNDLKCGENSMSNCASYLSEIHRVLTPKGVFICVSYGTPENREIYLKKVRYIFLLN